MAVKMMKEFDPQFEYALNGVYLQPFATLPFLYVISHMFSNGLSAVITLAVYSILIQVILPYLILANRLNAKTEVSGDSLYRMVKMIPMESIASTFMFNGELLKQIARFRENNTVGLGDPVETEESHEMNGSLDNEWILLHMIFFWIILIFVIEWRIPYCCCCRMKQSTRKDDEEFFGTP